MTEKRLQSLLTFLLLVVFGVLISQKINFVTADLGRHIKNGELILQGRDLSRVLTTNFYSYTFPDFPFLNHHWGSGVIFYLIQRNFGFVGISIFFLIINLATFGLFFIVAKIRGNFETAFLVSIILLPLMICRTEIRPEVFTYFLSGVYLLVLTARKQAREKIWILPILQLLWINLHSYFILGFMLLGIFGADTAWSLLTKKNENKAVKTKFLIVLILALFASFLNPAGIKGVLYPFKIFQNYGYRVLENQTVWFLDRILHYPPNFYFKIGFSLLCISWFLVFWKRKSPSFTNLILTVFVSYLGWTAVRNFALFGFFSLPIISENLASLETTRRCLARLDTISKYFMICSLAIFLFFVLFLLNIPYWQTRKSFGIGLKSGVEKGAEFFKNEKLQGPIFNNYDNGGYLIYYLYPQEKVFVDNRPEAYPAEFFNQVYIPMQEQEERWREMEQRYKFNIVFFYRHDLTPWAQTFLLKMINEPSWAPVYVDDYSIIFIKRIAQNQKLIEKFELPKEIFSIGS